MQPGQRIIETWRLINHLFHYFNAKSKTIAICRLMWWQFCRTIERKFCMLKVKSIIKWGRAKSAKGQCTVIIKTWELRSIRNTQFMQWNQCGRFFLRACKTGSLMIENSRKYLLILFLCHEKITIILLFLLE